MAETRKARRIDVIRPDGALVVAPGQTVELLTNLMPKDCDGELVALGTDVLPASGADQVRFTPYADQTPAPDYYDVRTQPGTVPIPYLAGFVIRRGQRFRLLVTNNDPINSYRCNARGVIELATS